MNLSPKAQTVLAQLEGQATKMGDLKRLAKELKRDHELALELWATGSAEARLVAVLILDKKRLDADLADRLHLDMRDHAPEEQTRLADWLLANQLTKSRGGLSLLESWELSPSPLQRRSFWYHQARLRWMGKPPPPNSEHLLEALEARLGSESEEVQWAMNFAAGQIGIHEPEHRDRCIALGERLELYREQVVPAGCTPNYLPEFIRIEVAKRAG